MLETTIALIGKISVGKSSVSKRLSKVLGIPYTSFGSYLVKYSKSQGLPVDRVSLQDLGEKFIRLDAREFLKMVVNDVSDLQKEVILEGIRHSSVMNEIKAISKKTIFVYLDGSSEVRYNRYLSRGKEGDDLITYEEFLLKDNHFVELETESLRSSCDLIVDSEELSIDEIVSRILLLIE